MPNALFLGVWQPKLSDVSQIRLRGFDNLSRLNTSGADLHSPVSAGRKLDANGLQIGVKPPSGFVVSVGYVVSKLRAFPAYVAAFCHMSLRIITRYDVS